MSFRCLLTIIISLITINLMPIFCSRLSFSFLVSFGVFLRDLVCLLYSCLWGRGLCLLLMSQHGLALLCCCGFLTLNWLSYSHSLLGCLEGLEEERVEEVEVVEEGAHLPCFFCNHPYTVDFKLQLLWLFFEDLHPCFVLLGFLLVAWWFPQR